MIEAPKGEQSCLLLNQLGRVSMFDETYQNGGISQEASPSNPKMATEQEPPRLRAPLGASDIAQRLCLEDIT